MKIPLKVVYFQEQTPLDCQGGMGNTAASSTERSQPGTPKRAVFFIGPFVLIDNEGALGQVAVPLANVKGMVPIAPVSAEEWSGRSLAGAIAQNGQGEQKGGKGR